MAAPNMFIVRVGDAPAAARFYNDLFEITPVFEHPAFIAFNLGGGVQLALWTTTEDDLNGQPQGSSELCLTLPDTEEIQALYQAWKNKGVRIVSEPRDEVFGRTFVVADPDGNLIRVAPED